MMHKVKLLGKLLGIALLLATLSGCASSIMQPASAPTADMGDKAMVSFMRPSYFGGAIQFGVWDGENFVGVSQAGSRIDYITNPGPHVFMARAENWSYVKAELQGGKHYYILLKPFLGVWKARVAFDPIRPMDESKEQLDKWIAESKPIVLIEEKRSEYVTERLPQVRQALAELDTNADVKYETLLATDFR